MRKYLGQIGNIPSVAVIIVAVLLISSVLYLSFKKSQTNDVSVTQYPTTQPKTASPSATVQTSAKTNPIKTPVTSQKTSPTPISTPTPSPSPESSIDISMACWRYDGYTDSMQVNIQASIYNPNKQGVYMTVADVKANKTIVFLAVQDDSLLVKTDAILKGKVNSIRGNIDSVEFQKDQEYIFKAYTAPFTNEMPNLTDLRAQTTASEDCR